MRHVIALLLLLVAAPMVAGEPKLVIIHDHNTLIVRGASLEVALSRHADLGDSYILIQRGGDSFTVADDALIAKAMAMYEPSREVKMKEKELRMQERELERRERDIERQADDIERQLDRIDDADDDDEMDAVMEKSRAELKLRDKELQRDEKKLEAEQDKLDALEEQLDKQRDAEEEKADQAVEKMIDDAIRSGKAKRLHH